MQPQAFRPSPRATRNPSKDTGKQRSQNRRSDDTADPLPSLLNRSQNMAHKKKNSSDSGMDEAQLILSKHRDLGYIPFLTAGHKMQHDAQAQFTAAKEDYQLIHPTGLVLTYATLSQYHPDATADKVLQMWKKAVEDWQTLGDMTRNSCSSHDYKELERLYGRCEKTLDKEKNRKSLMESYLQREEKMRKSGRRTGKTPADAFDAAAFESITFQEAATNDILLNTIFFANPKSRIDEGSGKQEQFQSEKNMKYVDFLAKKKQLQRSKNEPDAMDLYLAELELEAQEGNGHYERRKNPAERDPKKALAQTGAMMLTRAMQQAAKNAAKALKPV